MGIGQVGGRPAVFLDRDGILIESVVVDGKPYPAPDVASVRFVSGAADLCSRLRAAGYLLVCVTNQPDVARGNTKRETVESINRHIGSTIGIDQFRVCYHDDSDNCSCRKPRPGLLTGAADELGIDLGRSFMIGDRWKDVEAGKRAGCRTIFVDYHYSESVKSEPDFRITRVADALDIILATRGAGSRPNETNSTKGGESDESEIGS